MLSRVLMARSRLRRRGRWKALQGIFSVLLSFNGRTPWRVTRRIRLPCSESGVQIQEQEQLRRSVCLLKKSRK